MHNKCAVIQPAGRDNWVKELWTKQLSGESYRGEFEPDFIADIGKTPV
ncbi:MAG: hypothetical protein WBE22_10610 [Halobacteriota archaeon]